VNFLKKCGLYAAKCGLHAINGGSVLFGKLAKLCVFAGIVSVAAFSTAFVLGFVGACLGCMDALKYIYAPVALYVSLKMHKKLNLDTEIDSDMEIVRDWTYEKLDSIDESLARRSEEREIEVSRTMTPEEVEIIRARRINMHGRDVEGRSSVQQETPTANRNVRLERVNTSNARSMEFRAA